MLGRLGDMVGKKRIYTAGFSVFTLASMLCGLAPGLANAIAEHLIASTPGRPRSVQLRVGALPATPIGTLGYQLAFSPAGLINEYAEPCEILEDGEYRTVDPLTRFETVHWEGLGPLEALCL